MCKLKFITLIALLSMILVFSACSGGLSPGNINAPTASTVGTPDSQENESPLPSVNSSELEINQDVLALLNMTYGELDELYGLEFVEHENDNCIVFMLKSKNDFGTVSVIFNSVDNPDVPVWKIITPSTVLFQRDAVTLGMLKSYFNDYEYYIEPQISPRYTFTVWLIGDSSMVLGTQVYTFWFNTGPTDDTMVGEVWIPKYWPLED